MALAPNRQAGFAAAKKITQTEKAERPPRKWHRITIIAVWLLLYGSFTLFAPPLLDDADSVHAEAAREILVRGDWVTLHANGVRYLEKAPLMYWSMAASFRVFGARTWAARLPAALVMLALLLLVFSFGRRAFESRLAGFYAALIVATSFGPFIFSRILIPDIGLCLCVAGAMYCFWLSERQQTPSRLECWGFAIFCALGLLTKGLIGVVFPLGIVLAYLVMTRAYRRILLFHLPSSIAVFLLVAAPWHVLAALRNPAHGHPVGLMPTQGNVHGWLWFYFVNEHVLRYLNLRMPRDYDTVPLPLFWALLLVWLMPWTAFVAKALGQIPWRAAIFRRLGTERHRTLLLLALWAPSVMVFFSFSTTQEYYVLPAIPALALLIGGWLAEESGKPQSLRAGRRIAVVVLVLGMVGAAAAAALALLSKAPGPGDDLAGLLTRNPGDYALSFGHFLDLNARAMGAFRLPLAITALALSLGTLGNWLARRRGRTHLGNLSLAGMMVAFLVATHLALVTFAPVLSSKQLADAVRPLLKPQDMVMINGEYESGSTLGFYLRRDDLHILNGRSSNLWYGSFFPDAPGIFEDNASFAAKWPGPRRIFLWTETDAVPAAAAPGYVIAKGGGKEILSNRP